MLTQTRLKEVLHYDQETGGFAWRVSPTNSVKAGDIAGSHNWQGYLAIKVDGKVCKAHRLAWLYTYGYFPENDLDHIDRVRDNNRISNLREVSRSCNMRNTGNNITNTSGVKGVYWHKGTGKWRAVIAGGGKQIHLGLHDDLLEASCHRLAAEQADNWDGCDSASPAYLYVKKHLNGSRR